MKDNSNSTDPVATRRYAHPHRPPLDLQRVARALFLDTRLLGDTLYQVAGEGDVYNVTLEPLFTCDCGDAIFRETICKHQIAVLLMVGDEEALAIRRTLREAWRESRKKQAQSSSPGEEVEACPTDAMVAPNSPQRGALPLPEPVAGPPTLTGKAERVVLRRWW